MATPFMKDKQMNNWPNPNALGEPKFPEICRPHFLSYKDAKLYGGLPDYVKRDTFVAALWSPPLRSWMLLDGQVLKAEQVAAECGYISPCYTEEEMRQAKIDAVETAISVCLVTGDKRIDDSGASGAYACAELLQKWKEDI